MRVPDAKSPRTMLAVTTIGPLRPSPKGGTSDTPRGAMAVTANSAVRVDRGRT